MRIAASTVGLAVALMAWTAHADDTMRWVQVRDAGIEAEIPEFMTTGFARALMVNGEDTGTAYEPEDHPIAVRVYRVPSKRPIRFLEALFGNGRVTYRVDKPNLGVLSGYRDDDVFYAICRPGPAVLRCIDIVYPAAQKDEYDPITTRIAKSFRQ